MHSKLGEVRCATPSPITVGLRLVSQSHSAQIDLAQHFATVREANTSEYYYAPPELPLLVP